MSTFKEKWHKHPILVVIIGAVVVTPIGSIISDWYKRQPILTSISNFTKWLYDIIVTAMHYEVKVWVFVMLSLLILVLIKCIFYYKRSKLPLHFNYNEDVFNGWVWRWKWKQKDFKKGEWAVVELNPYCPNNNCDTELIYSRNKSAVMECARCKSYFAHSEWTHPDYITILINDNVRKGIFKKQSNKRLFLK